MMEYGAEEKGMRTERRGCSVGRDLHASRLGRLPPPEAKRGHVHPHTRTVLVFLGGPSVGAQSKRMSFSPPPSTDRAGDHDSRDDDREHG